MSNLYKTIKGDKLQAAIAYLDNVRLNITQWLLLTAAVTIGGLVTLLSIKGNQLHRARVELISQAISLQQTQEEAKLEDMRKALIGALEDYHNAK